MKRLLISLLLLLASPASSPASDLTQRLLTQREVVRASETQVTDFRFSGSAHQDQLSKLISNLDDYHVKWLLYTPGLNNTKHVIGETGCDVKEGKSAPYECIIFLEPKMSPDCQLSTLFHELGHVMHVNEIGEIPRTHAEIIAETIAWEANRLVGLNTNRESMSYILMFSDDDVRTVLIKYDKWMEEKARELARKAGVKVGD